MINSLIRDWWWSHFLTPLVNEFIHSFTLCFSSLSTEYFESLDSFLALRLFCNCINQLMSNMNRRLTLGEDFCLEVGIKEKNSVAGSGARGGWFRREMVFAYLSWLGGQMSQWHEHLCSLLFFDDWSWYSLTAVKGPQQSAADTRAQPSISAIGEPTHPAFLLCISGVMSLNGRGGRSRRSQRRRFSVSLREIVYICCLETEVESWGGQIPVPRATICLVGQKSRQDYGPQDCVSTPLHP